MEKTEFMEVTTSMTPWTVSVGLRSSTSSQNMIDTQSNAWTNRPIMLVDTTFVVREPRMTVSIGLARSSASSQNLLDTEINV